MSPSRAWLMKTEPETYSYSDLEREGRTSWDGVRNYQARNHMIDMAVGDRVLVYHSVKERAVVGVATVVATAHQDPSTDDPRWQCVDIAPVRRLDRPLTLAEIKADPSLAGMVLVRSSRLSVQPVAPEEWDRVLALSRADDASNVPG